MTTQEHIRQMAWWPTKALPAQEKYVGTAACGKCHAGIVSSQQGSQMARTLGHAADSDVLNQHIQQSYRSGPYTYTLKQNGRDVSVVVTDGDQSRSAQLQWTFGSGEIGQSFLWRKDGAFHENRFNYFSTMRGFAATPGRLQGAPASLDMALGRQLTDTEAKTCFSCHSTAMTNAMPLDTSRIMPGINCEACHGPGAEHVAAMNSRQFTGETHIVNPAKLSPVQSVDFCGACHSSPWDVQLMGAVGVATVRFPAYRLEKSRCWGIKGDARVTCIACHDPHQPLAHQPSSYDHACLVCHLQKPHAKSAAGHPATACPVATKDCVSCHMPKYDIPEMHYKFTDHMIRVARENAPFPE